MLIPGTADHTAELRRCVRRAAYCNVVYWNTLTIVWTSWPQARTGRSILCLTFVIISLYSCWHIYVIYVRNLVRFRIYIVAYKFTGNLSVVAFEQVSTVFMGRGTVRYLGLWIGSEWRWWKSAYEQPNALDIICGNPLPRVFSTPEMLLACCLPQGKEMR